MLITHRQSVRIVFIVAVLSLSVSVAASWAQSQGASRKIVVFSDRMTDKNAQADLVAQKGGAPIKPLGLVNATVATLSASAIRDLKRERAVVRIDDDAEVVALGKPSASTKPTPTPTTPPAQVLPWGVNRIDAEYAWPLGATGAGVKVAVLDTGIDNTHPDLASNCKGGVNTIFPRKSYADDNGHGTHVAGIIAAVNNSIGVVGVAPEASLYAVKVLDRTGSGYISDIIEGLDWCIQNGIQVANMSLGSDSDVLSFHEACDRAKAAGVILVAAAGNDGAAVDFPGAYDSVIAVAAVDSLNARASWSSYGPEVDIAAPGVNVYSTWMGGKYQTASGTSMATPHVVGAIALNLSANIFTSADDLSPAGPDAYTGYGLVDAGEAASGTVNYGNDLP